MARSVGKGSDVQRQWTHSSAAVPLQPRLSGQCVLSETGQLDHQTGPVSSVYTTGKLVSMARTSNHSTEEVEAGGYLRGRGQHNLHKEFQASYIVRYCLTGGWRSGVPTSVGCKNNSHPVEGIRRVRRHDPKQWNLKHQHTRHLLQADCTS